MALDRKSWLGFGAALGAYAIAFVVLSLGGTHRSAAIVWVGGALMLVAAGVLGLTLRRIRHRNDLGPLRRLAIPLIIVAAGAALCAVWYFADVSDGWGLFGLCAAFVGLGHVVGEFRTWTLGAPWRGLVWLVVCAVIFGIGLWGALAVSVPWLLVSLGAIALVPIGLSLLSEDVLRARDLPFWSLIAVGVGVGVVGAVGLMFAGIAWFFVAIIVVTAGVLVGAIASNTQADVILVAIVVALVWVATPQGVDLDDAVMPSPGEPTLVSLGDSYMSGEGADTFYNGTNDSGVNECRRAPTAYAHLAVTTGEEGMPTRLAFFACSGARAIHIYGRPQWAGEPVPPSGESQTTGLDQLDQLKALLASGDTDIPLVIVSIGGNDAGFGEVAVDCLAPGDCTERGQVWLDRLDDVAPNIDRAYQEIRAAVGTEVPVLVVPYPEPIRPTRCDYSLLSNDEHEFLYGFVQQLNNVVRQSAKDAGFYYLGAMTTSMEDNDMRICDGDADDIGVNFLALESVSGLLGQSLNPANWFHNSLHPNVRGHVVMADVLEQWMRDHPDPAPKSDDDSEAGPFNVASLTGIMGTTDIEYCGGTNEPAYCDRTPNDWAITQVAVLVLRATIPAAVLVLGWWLVWLPILRRTRPLWSSVADKIETRVF